MKPLPTEHSEQVALVTWAKSMVWKWPELEWLYAVPNGGLRHPATAGKLKAEGVRPGVPDLVLPVPRGTFHGLYLEMKRPGGQSTEAQKRWGVYLTSVDYAYKLAFGFKDAQAFISEYLAIEP